MDNAVIIDIASNADKQFNLFSSPCASISESKAGVNYVNSGFSKDSHLDVKSMYTTKIHFLNFWSA